MGSKRLRQLNELFGIAIATLVLWWGFTRARAIHSASLLTRDNHSGISLSSPQIPKITFRVTIILRQPVIEASSMPIRPPMWSVQHSWATWKGKSYRSLFDRQIHLVYLQALGHYNNRSKTAGRFAISALGKYISQFNSNHPTSTRSNQPFDGSSLACRG